MPFNGSGTFTRVMNWVGDAASGIKIRADRHDSEDDNLAAGLSNCLTKDGQTTPTADIKLGGRKLINVADPINDQDAATKKWIADNVVGGALIADTPPAAGKVGNLWWDSDSGNLFLRFDDGSSVQWVQVNVASPSAYSAFLQRQVVTASGGITLNAETRAFLVEIVAGGGGGGQIPSTVPASQASGGTGGAGGAYASKWIIRPSGTFTPSVTIGAGGGSQAAGGQTSYSDGTNSMLANGGSAGFQLGPSGNFMLGNSNPGQAAAGGNINRDGERGEGAQIYGAINVVRSGSGGDSAFGVGGWALATNAGGGLAVGNPGTGYGAGGGGAIATSGGGGVGGGAGSPGVCVITEYR